MNTTFTPLPVDEHEEQSDLREMVRGLLTEHATPQRLTEFDENEAFDEDLYQILVRSGLVQLESDTDGNLSRHQSQIVVLEELGATATSIGVSFVVQYMATTLLAQHGTQDQRNRYLHDMFDGGGRAAFALTEPGGGTDVARAMQTRASKNDDGTWTLNGTKMWISGATDCRFFIALARTAPIGRSSVAGITMFLVAADTPGITVREMDTVAIHGLSTCEVVFDDVTLPANAVLGEPDRGFYQVISTLNGERLNAAAVALGIARGAHNASLEYVRTREAFGKPIGAFQILQSRLVDEAIRIESARALLQRAARAADDGTSAETLSAMAKLAASDAATTATEQGMRAMGGSGLSREYPMQRYWRDARLYTFAPLTDEMMHNFIAEHHLGLPRSY